MGGVIIFFPSGSSTEIVCLNVSYKPQSYPRDVVVRSVTVGVLCALPTAGQTWYLVPAMGYFSSFGIFAEKSKEVLALPLHSLSF